MLEGETDDLPVDVKGWVSAPLKFVSQIGEVIYICGCVSEAMLQSLGDDLLMDV